jgi:hypothetical protein
MEHNDENNEKQFNDGINSSDPNIVDQEGN